jgi:hypothetical protein
MKGQLKPYFLIILIILIFGLFMYFLSLIVNSSLGSILPASVISVYTFTKQFFDGSIIFLFLILIIMDMLVAWFRPNKLLAALNFVMVFALGYINLSLKALTIPIANSLTTNVLLPNSNLILTSPYTVIVIYFALVVGIVLNLREPNDQQ